MFKKIVGIVLAMMLIMVILVFGGSVLTQVDTSGVSGSVMEDSINMILTTANGSFTILLILVVLLAAGSVIVVLQSINKKSGGRRKRRKSRK